MVLEEKLRGAEMKCLSINIDQGIPMQTLPETIYLKEKEIDRGLFKDAKKNWRKIELAYYTVYYGRTLYEKSPFEGVLYVDHEKRLDAENAYVEELRKEKMKAQKRLNNLRPKFYGTKEPLQERIKPIAEKLVYHNLDYEVFEITEDHHLAVRKGRHKGRKHYSFRYLFEEKREPDFSSYELCLLKGWGRDLEKFLYDYEKTGPDKSLSDFIEAFDFRNTLRSHPDRNYVCDVGGALHQGGIPFNGFCK